MPVLAISVPVVHVIEETGEEILLLGSVSLVVKGKSVPAERVQRLHDGKILILRPDAISIVWNP